MLRFCLRRLMLPLNWSARHSRFPVFLLLLALVPAPMNTAAGQASNGKKTTAKAKPAGDTIPDGPALSIEFILKMLAQVKADVTDEPRIIAFINKRGLDFDGTQQNLDRLRIAGATADLIQLVATLKPPPPAPPPPPPAPVTGTVELICAPAECSVRVDSGAERRTRSGKLMLDGMSLKDYSLEFRKEGYASRTERLVIASVVNPPLKVSLEPTSETKALWGRDLFAAVLRAIGGPSGLAEIKTFTASGAASSWDISGALSEWGIKAVFTPTTNSYDLGNASSGSFRVACEGEICPQKGKSSFGRKKVSGADAASLNTNIVQYNRYHLVALLERASGGDHRLLANAPPSPGLADQHLIIESREENYDITLDSSFLPASVTFKSKDGLDSVKVTYALWNYLGNGSRYPRHTSVALPGEKQHGIHVRFENVAARAK
jgi:hypothetical protein